MISNFQVTNSETQILTFMKVRLLTKMFDIVVEAGDVFVTVIPSDSV